MSPTDWSYAKQPRAFDSEAFRTCIRGFNDYSEVQGSEPPHEVASMHLWRSSSSTVATRSAMATLMTDARSASWELGSGNHSRSILCSLNTICFVYEILNLMRPNSSDWGRMNRIVNVAMFTAPAYLRAAVRLYLDQDVCCILKHWDATGMLRAMGTVGLTNDLESIFVYGIRCKVSVRGHLGAPRNSQSAEVAATEHVKRAVMSVTDLPEPPTVDDFVNVAMTTAAAAHCEVGDAEVDVAKDAAILAIGIARSRGEPDEGDGLYTAFNELVSNHSTDRYRAVIATASSVSPGAWATFLGDERMVYAPWIVRSGFLEFRRFGDLVAY